MALAWRTSSLSIDGYIRLPFARDETRQTGQTAACRTLNNYCANHYWVSFASLSARQHNGSIVEYICIVYLSLPPLHGKVHDRQVWPRRTDGQVRHTHRALTCLHTLGRLTCVKVISLMTDIMRNVRLPRRRCRGRRRCGRSDAS